MDLKQIKNIIFDLGGVIINIDYGKSIEYLQKLCKDNCNIAFSQKEQSYLFDLYETGASSNEEFRNNLRQAYQIDATDEQIDDAWNAMLLDIPQERIDLLLALGKHYRVFLLSNTNAIHLKRFNEIVAHTLQSQALTLCSRKATIRTWWANVNLMLPYLSRCWPRTSSTELKPCS
ncbi:HAD family hydrolase [Pontibacter rugosus]